ncbi:hypothetical protein KKC94_02960 [Patescibacteria group bacterium]|nr:hypothetical protein [Patescibacteria group bacterium]
MEACRDEQFEGLDDVGAGRVEDFDNGLWTDEEKWGIALRYTALVGGIIMSFISKGRLPVEYKDDAMDEGLILIFENLHKFDPNRGDPARSFNDKLLTYMTNSMKMRLVSAIAVFCNSIHMIGFGRRLMERQEFLRKTERELFAELGRSPSEGEIAEKLGISVDKLGRWRKEAMLILEPEDVPEGTACLDGMSESSDLENEANIDQVVRDRVKSLVYKGQNRNLPDDRITMKQYSCVKGKFFSGQNTFGELPSNAEVGRRRGVSASTVSNRINAARARLMKDPLLRELFEKIPS